MVFFQFAIYAFLFLLELFGLLAFIYWGFHLNKGLLWRIIFGLGTPIVVAVFWGTFVAPKASYPVSIPVRTMLQLIVFGLAALALYATNKKTLAFIFVLATIIILSVILLLELR